jgi:hypothetical protein
LLWRMTEARWLGKRVAATHSYASTRHKAA